MGQDVYDLGVPTKRAQDPLCIPDAMIDVHLHLPASAQKKDGPSAGVAMVRRPHFLSGFGAKMMGRGPGTGLCDLIPLDGEVCPSYDCLDRRGEHFLFPLLPL